MRLTFAAIPLALLLPLRALAAGPVLDLPQLTEAQVEAFHDAQSQAQEALASKDWPRAARAYQKAARIHGGNDGLWYNLACVQALQGRTSDAMASLQEALDAGWSDATWPAKDSDLTALHDRPEFQAWLQAVEAKAATKPARSVPAPADLGTSPESIERLATAAEERLDAVAPVLGSEERSKANEALSAWKLASWDAVAAAATDDAARTEAEWSALRSLVRDDLTPPSPEVVDAIVARADRFAEAHAGSAHADEARLAAANARFTRTWGPDEARMKEGRAAYERELLQIAASGTHHGLQLALAKLLGLTEDMTLARALHARLRSLVGDDAALAKLTLAEARGAHWRLAGLPSFEAKTLDGRTITPDALRGKVTLVDFWATWCGPCRGELPHIKEAYSKFKDRGFEVIGVSLDLAKGGDPTAFNAWCAENGVTWPQIFDGKHWQAQLAQTFGVQSIPFPLLIDRDGRVAFADEQLRGPGLSERVESLLEPPVGT